MIIDYICPNCGKRGISIFYELKNVPVHSALLLPTREEALGYPKGNIALGFCNACGFIANVAFDPSLHEYSSRYEPTQSFSATFNSFHRKLATHLITQYNLYNKSIIEIGCGQGEFLILLCELGSNRGFGFDPAYHNGRKDKKQMNDRFTIIKDFYSENYADYKGDFVCCKMTLEHIQQTASFVSSIRRSIGNLSDTAVFFQVPNVRRILQDLAFWDIYYEHCSYFSLGSLARLFRKCSFDVIELWKDYDEQYLMIATKPTNREHGSNLAQENDITELTRDVSYFSKKYQQKLNTWKRNLQGIKQTGKKAVIWGAGSKGVAFLTTLKIQDEIEYVVDINPYKQGTYMAGTGHEIVAPEFLQAYRPDFVVVMNPVYYKEIQQYLDQIGVTADVITV